MASPPSKNKVEDKVMSSRPTSACVFTNKKKFKTRTKYVCIKTSTQSNTEIYLYSTHIWCFKDNGCITWYHPSFNSTRFFLPLYGSLIDSENIVISMKLKWHSLPWCHYLRTTRTVIHSLKWYHPKRFRKKIRQAKPINTLGTLIYVSYVSC